MSQDESQNFFAHDYDDLNEDEFCVFESGSPNRSDDAQLVRARPVALIQSAPSQILLKNRKIQMNDSTLGKVKETSMSEKALAATHLPPPVYGIQRQVVPNGYLAMDLDPDLEEFVGVGGKSSFGIDQCKSSKITIKRKSAPSDHHETDQLPIGLPPSGSSIALVPSKSLGNRPLGEVEVETEVPGPPPASVVSDTNEEVATKLAQYLSYFRKDAIAHFASHPTELLGLFSTLCPSEEAAQPLFHMFRDDPVISKMLRRVAGWGYHKGKKGMQQNLYRTLENALPDDWEEVRAVLPDDLTPLGPEPFSKPPTSPIDPSATSSCNQPPDAIKPKDERLQKDQSDLLEAC
nr:hypothetical protein Iba_chr12bCG18000 [Ipomoea batatas]